MMSIARCTEKALRKAPQHKTQPPISMENLQPSFLVIIEAKKDAKRVAKYRDDVNMVGKGSAEVALSLVGYDQELKSAMECVFGSTFVCKTIDAAREFTKNTAEKDQRACGAGFVFSEKTFSFAVRDSLINDGPIKDFSYGLRINADPNAVGIAKQSNYELNGALCVLQQSIRPEMMTQEGTTKEDIERLPKYKFWRIGDFEKQNGEIQESFGGIITECDTESPIEHVLSPENATTVVLVVDIAFVYCAIYNL
ncbi:Cleavage and polyadenylation specificity factor subunit 1 [Camellia lanceoleosa]|uniref:Cleavage and polyadenylation specificity factor subunit 1 n=1 Tax=Camellia lanceoleosa TaxID=1840588 RepID=A0ACC0J1F0_9ERIC|nr:Cleavage and polyadenylation specificity factor subunit 1 [Camellia lanceoleosa]